jgi:hypothetical protein
VRARIGTDDGTAPSTPAVPRIAGFDDGDHANSKMFADEGSKQSKVDAEQERMLMQALEAVGEGEDESPMTGGGWDVAYGATSANLVQAHATPGTNTDASLQTSSAGPLNPTVACSNGAGGADLLTDAEYALGALLSSHSHWSVAQCPGVEARRSIEPFTVSECTDTREISLYTGCGVHE